MEFGLCRQDGQLKAYGAGLLSSFGELEYACAPYRPAGDTDEMPEYLPWDPMVAAEKSFPITSYQPTYFVADSLTDAKLKMRQFCETINRPFYARFNANTNRFGASVYQPLLTTQFDANTTHNSVWVDRAVNPVVEE